MYPHLIFLQSHTQNVDQKSRVRDIPVQHESQPYHHQHPLSTQSGSRQIPIQRLRSDSPTTSQNPWHNSTHGNGSVKEIPIIRETGPSRGSPQYVGRAGAQQGVGRSAQQDVGWAGAQQGSHSTFPAPQHQPQQPPPQQPPSQQPPPQQPPPPQQQPRQQQSPPQSQQPRPQASPQPTRIPEQPAAPEQHSAAGDGGLNIDPPLRQRSPSPANLTSQERVELILLEAEELQRRVNRFGGLKATKEYRLLEEMLTQLLLKLDGIDSEGKEEIRKVRRCAVKVVTASIDMLELKASSRSQPLLEERMQTDSGVESDSTTASDQARVSEMMSNS